LLLYYQHYLVDYRLTVLTTDKRYEEERAERKAARRQSRSRRDRDEFSDEDSENEFKAKVPKALEAPPGMSGGAAQGEEADFRERRREREREREKEEQMSYVGTSANDRRNQRERGWEDEERGRY
jgi:hypothetical protein